MVEVMAKMVVVDIELAKELLPEEKVKGLPLVNLESRMEIYIVVEEAVRHLLSLDILKVV